MKDRHAEIDRSPQGPLVMLLAANADAYLAFRCALTLLRGEEIPADDQARLLERSTAVLGKEPYGEPSGDIRGLSARRAGVSVAMLLRSGDPQDLGPALLALSKHLEANREDTPSPGDADFPGLEDLETLSFLGFTCSLAASSERQRAFWASLQALREGISDADATGAAEDDGGEEITHEQEGERVLAASILVNTCAVDPEAYLVFRCAVALAKGEAVSDEDHEALARVLSDTWGESWRDHERIQAEAAELAHEPREEIPEMVAGYLALGEPTLAILHMVLYLDRVRTCGSNGGTE